MSSSDGNHKATCTITVEDSKPSSTGNNKPASGGSTPSGSGSSSVNPPAQVTVTFDDGSNKTTKTVTKGQKFGTLPEEPKKDGFVFKGWFDSNGNQLTADTVINDAITFNAKWDKVSVPQKVTISGLTEVDYNKTITLTAKVEPEDATNKEVTWSSSNDGIATVDPKTGVVKGVSGGKVTITAKTANGIIDIYEVTVHDVYTYRVMDPTDDEMAAEPQVNIAVYKNGQPYNADRVYDSAGDSLGKYSNGKGYIRVDKSFINSIYGIKIGNNLIKITKEN